MMADPAPPLPLEGFRVVEFAQLVAGPSAGLLLADYGADIVKVEPPEGDAGRRLRSAAAYDVAEAPVFTAYNRNKQSIRLDLKSPKGRAQALALIDDADVVLESARPGVMDRLGLGAQAMLDRFPSLVYASISGFGETPSARDRGGVDMIIQAESGVMSTTGLPDLPLKVGFTIIDAAAGHALCHGILAALLRRARTGVGGIVRTSLYEVALHLQTGPLVEYLVTGTQTPRAANSAPLTAPADLMRCRTGEIVISAYQDHHWRGFCSAIGGEHLLADPRYIDADVRVTNRDALKQDIELLLQAHDAEEWIGQLRALGLLVGEVRDYSRVVADVVTRETGLIVSAGDSFAVRSPVELRGTPAISVRALEQRPPDDA